jgi:hypothetical protein
MPVLRLVTVNDVAIYVLPAIVLWPTECDGVWFWLCFGVGRA